MMSWYHSKKGENEKSSCPSCYNLMWKQPIITDIIMLKDLQDEIEKHREMYMSLNNTGEK